MAEPGVHGVFFKNAVLHGFQSEQQKRAIYIDQDWIRITVAGQDKDIVERKVREDDKERFAVEWAKYEAGQAQARIGTPLEMWPRMTPGMVATLKAINILTVEDMATLSDTGVQRVGMEGYKLRTEAQSFLNSAAQASAVMEVERLQATVDTQAQQIAELTALVKEAAAREAAREAVRESVQPAPRSRKKAETA
jgi:hypothetical protein